MNIVKYFGVQFIKKITNDYTYMYLYIQVQVLAKINIHDNYTLILLYMIHVSRNKTRGKIATIIPIIINSS